MAADIKLEPIGSDIHLRFYALSAAPRVYMKKAVIPSLEFKLWPVTTLRAEVWASVVIAIHRNE